MESLNFIVWDMSPEIFSLFGSISLRYYSLFFVLGIYLSYLILQKVYVLEGQKQEDLDRLFIYTSVGIILGARLGHCIFYDPSYYLQHPLEILLPIVIYDNGGIEFTGFQGLASHGGAMGILIAIFLFVRKTKMNIWTVLDQLALVIPLAAASIRFGNLMNSEIIGHITQRPWAFRFMQVDGLPRHPTQLYEAISYVLILISMFLLYRKTDLAKRKGVLFGIFLSLLFSARIIIEFFKIRQESFENTLLLNMGQILSIPFVLAGLTIIFIQLYPLGIRENAVK